MSTLLLLEDVNKRINALPFKNELGDDWTPIVPEGGDCDSYATAKYEALIKAGIPTSSLRLATCWVETGEYHAVLLIEVEGQTWVLDNRYPHPIEYQLLPYKWHKLQIAGTNQFELAASFLINNQQ